MILSLDQSSRVSGWAVFDEDQLITYGKFSIDNADGAARLTRIKQTVAELIQQHNITEIVMEDIQLQASMGNNVQTFKMLAEVFGVLQQYFNEQQIPTTAVLASQWKSTLGIKGKARAEQKQNAQLYVFNTYNIKATQDECDAICIGTHYIKTKKSFLK